MRSVPPSGKTIKKIYDGIQSQALAICCGSMKSTSVSSLQIECGELPLDLRRKQFITNHATKSIAIPTNPTKEYYFQENRKRTKTQIRLSQIKGNSAPHEIVEKQITPNLIRCIATRKSSNFKRPPWILKCPKIDKTNLTTPAENPLRMLIAKEKIEDLHENLLCCTDESKIKDNAGIGIYITKNKKEISIRTSSHSSICSTEMAAIDLCLQFLKQQSSKLKIFILSDSLSSIGSVAVHRILSLISDIQEAGGDLH